MLFEVISLEVACIQNISEAAHDDFIHKQYITLYRLTNFTFAIVLLMPLPWNHERYETSKLWLEIRQTERLQQEKKNPH